MPSVESLASKFRGVMADEGQLHEFTESMILAAADFAQAELAKASGLTTASIPRSVWDRRAKVPENCINLNRVTTQ